MADTLDLCGRYADLFARFVDLFITCHAAVSRPRLRPAAMRNLNGFARRLTTLSRRVDGVMPRPPHQGDYVPADFDANSELELAARQRTAAYLHRLLEPIRQTLLAGHWA